MTKKKPPVCRNEKCRKVLKWPEWTGSPSKPVEEDGSEHICEEVDDREYDDDPVILTADKLPPKHKTENLTRAEHQILGAKPANLDDSFPTDNDMYQYLIDKSNEAEREHLILAKIYRKLNECVCDQK